MPQLLQAGFNKKKIDRYIEVDKLTKRSFQFNMEFLQFMKCYWDMHSPAGGGGGAPADALDQKENVASTGIGAPPAREPVAKAPAASRARAAPAASHAGGAAAGGEARAAKAAAAQAEEDAKAVEVTELKLHVENLERERDFYYAKLREVEVLCQQKESEQARAPPPEAARTPAHVVRTPIPPPPRARRRARRAEPPCPPPARCPSCRTCSRSFTVWTTTPSSSRPMATRRSRSSRRRSRERPCESCARPWPRAATAAVRDASAALKAERLGLGA